MAGKGCHLAGCNGPAAGWLGINPLEASPGADLGPRVVADVMGIIKKVMGASWDTAVQMQEILENGLLAVLSGEPRPTMAHLFKLLSDTDYRFDLTRPTQRSDCRPLLAEPGDEKGTGVGYYAVGPAPARQRLPA